MKEFTIESREDDGEVVLWGTREGQSPSAWNFYTPPKKATILKLEQDDIPACYTRCTSWKEFSAAKGEYWLAQPVVKIDAATYDEALECLPPIAWNHFETGGERFILSEAQDGPFHRQFYLDRRTGRGIYKYVHLREQSTWLTHKDLAEAYKTDDNTPEQAS